MTTRMLERGPRRRARWHPRAADASLARDWRGLVEAGEDSDKTDAESDLRNPRDGGETLVTGAKPS